MRLVVLGSAFVGTLPAKAQVQGSRTCRVELVQAEMGRQIGSRTYGSGGVSARCIGQPTTMRSDSFAWYSELNRVDFVGTVRFRDSTVSLDADRAVYFTVDERLEAFGHVRLENHETGSVLTGPMLTYLREAPGVRDAAELMAPQRPTVEYRSTESADAAPYIIVGDRVRLRGGAAWAGGAVTIDRDDFSTRSDSAEINIDVGEGLLTGHAEASSRDTVGYRMHGSRISFRLTDNRLTWVQAQGSARTTSAGWRIAGDTIEFQVGDDLIQGGSVWGDSTRPSAESASYIIAADSLALDTPGQVLTEVRGFGTARATSRVDSVTVEPDWIAGDTVVARFDSTEAGRRLLVLMEARGNAKAFYRVYDEADREAPPALSYSRGARIVARFKDDELQQVDVVDAADGVYLEPARRRRPR